MSGFWAKSSGEVAEATMDQEGAESGKLVRIPDNTMVKAIITDVELSKVREDEFIADEYETDGYRFTWNIIEEGEFNGVNVKQAVRVMSRTNNKRDQALDVLAFMDVHMNEGRFMAAGEAPDIIDMLEAYQNKPMLVKIRAMAGTNQETGAETYNQWVSGVFRKKPEGFEAHPTKEAAINAATQKIQQQQQQKAAAGPKPTGPAKGPAVNKAPTETAAEKSARLRRELEEAEAAESAKQNAQATDANVNQMANEIAGEIEGAEDNDGPLDY